MAQDHLINIPKLELRMVEPICKELEIETETKMAKWLRQLLFQHNGFASNSFIVMYLNGPRTVSIHVLPIVHLERAMTRLYDEFARSISGFYFHDVYRNISVSLASFILKERVEWPGKKIFLFLTQ